MSPVQRHARYTVVNVNVSSCKKRVQKLCEENRIPGVAKFSRMWLIPKDAEKPTDKRRKNFKSTQ
nr:hypothetical protein [uncultured Acetatifactor sp.]